MSLYVPYAYRYLWRTEKNNRFPGVEIAAVTNHPLCCGCCELDLDPLEYPYLPLIMKPSWQPLNSSLYKTVEIAEMALEDNAQFLCSIKMYLNCQEPSWFMSSHIF